MSVPLTSARSKSPGDDVGGILLTLEQNVAELGISEADLSQTLTRLKSLIVQSNDSKLLFTPGSLHILCSYGFDKAQVTASRIALRCICNLLVLSEPTWRVFVDQNRVVQAVDWMRSDNSEDQFITSRLLLLCTYGANLNLNELVESSDLCSILRSNLVRYENYIQPDGSFRSEIDLIACDETLKLLCNLLARLPDKTSFLDDFLAPLFRLLRKIAIPSPPLQPPISSLINCLIFFKLENAAEDHLFHAHAFSVNENNANVDRLSKILTLAAQSYSGENLDKHASPLLQALLKIAEISPPQPKARLKTLILPSDEDRETVLGEGNSLSAILLRAASSVASSRLRYLIPALFFELSDRDPRRLVHNVGYGYGSGFLVSLGMQLPASSVDGSGSEEELEINPIPGQKLDKEPDINLLEMTDEEKEREAERLFVLFERLRAMGVIDVENPVSAATHTGRLEEIE